MSGFDPRGNAVSTASAEALDATEHALWRAMSFYGTPLDDLDAAAAADPAWSLPRTMKAGFLLSLTEPSLLADARAELDAAGRLATARGNDRERGHVAALRRLAGGDRGGAGDAWRAHLDAHPRDALALQWAHLNDFHRGNATELRDRVAAALPHWRDASDPLRAFVLGLHAFGLEETGDYVAAESEGRGALAADPRVPWATHAVAHVMEMQGRPDEGRDWMAAQRRHWGDEDSGNGFAGHLGWHEALFAAEALDHDAALAAFDRYLGPDAIEITLQRIDAASLLWRLALAGVPVGDRFQRLLHGWPDDGGAGGSVFNDLHRLLALIGAGNADGAGGTGSARESDATRRWAAQSIEAAASGPSSWNRIVASDIGVPLMQGFIDFAAGRHDDAFDRLASARARAAPIGGSHAQRDVIDQTMLAAAAHGTRRAEGRELLAARGPARVETPLGRHWQRALAPG